MEITNGRNGGNGILEIRKGEALCAKVVGEVRPVVVEQRLLWKAYEKLRCHSHHFHGRRMLESYFCEFIAQE